MPCTIALFLGGKTGFELASWAGVSTACYTLVLPAAAVECVLMQGFFADRRAIAVTVIGISASLLAVIISYVCIVSCGISQPVPVLCIVSLGFVLSRFLKSCALACYFQRSAPLFQYREIIVFLAKVLTLSLLTGGCAWLLSQGMAHILPDGIADAFQALQSGTAPVRAISRLKILLRLAVAGSGAFLTFCLGAWLLRLQEPRLMLTWIKQKFSRH
jgi:peptidoglycan biosynthesis protein MviN/MurJ (putative lipid II flippase)